MTYVVSNSMLGRVLWLTGLSGSGKSTIARHIQNRMIHAGQFPLILDGDDVRSAIDDPYWGFDLESRLRGSYRYAKLAALAANQGLTAIVPTISMYHEVHQWSRSNIPNYYEVYLRTTEETRRKRDPKVLYKQHLNGKNDEMPGLDLEVQIPVSPDLLIDNDGDETSIQPVAEQILVNFNARTSQKTLGAEQMVLL